MAREGALDVPGQERLVEVEPAHHRAMEDRRDEVVEQDLDVDGGSELTASLRAFKDGDRPGTTGVLCAPMDLGEDRVELRLGEHREERGPQVTVPQEAGRCTQQREQVEPQVAGVRVDAAQHVGAQRVVEQLGQVGPVPVEGRARDLGACGDAAHRDATEADLADELDGRVQHPLTRPDRPRVERGTGLLAHVALRAAS